MSVERTQAGKFGDWTRISATVRANSADLAHLEVPVTQLEALLTQGVDLTKEQRGLRASKQEKTQKLKAVLAEGSRLATLLRNSVKQHYGPTSEKLTEFGLQPFRGRKARPAPEPDPEPPVSPEVKAGR